MAIGKFLVKTGAFVGTFYYVKTLGVWGQSVETEKVYNDMKDKIRPHMNELQRKLPFEVPALPPNGEVRYLVKHYYNEGVKSTFNFISMMPCYAGQLVMKTKTSISQLFEPVPQSKDSDNK